MTSSTNFSGPVKVQGRYVATLSADGSSLVDGAGKAFSIPAAIAELSRRLSDSRIDNALTRTPLAAVPAWTISTAYPVGQYVSNGGNEYVCRVAGTSAGSGGPTTTVYGDITDGTAIWQYVQPQRATTTSANAPTITTGNKGADLLKQYRAIEEASSFSFYGGTPVASSASGVIFPAISSLQAGVVVTTTPGKDNANPCIHIVTDALSLAFESGGYLTNLRRFVIEVDGVLYQDAPVVGNSTGYHVLIDFTGKAKKARSIKLYWRRGAPEEFRGVWVSMADKVWKPPVSPRMVVLGDSFVSGSSYGGSFNAGQEWTSMAGQLLGIDDTWNIGQGSSGFVTTAGGTRYRHIERLTDATDPNPDVLVIAGCHNDLASDQATITAAVLAYLRAFRAVCPSCRIIVFGTWQSLANSLLANTATMEAAMSDAVTQFNDSLTVFVPCNSDPSGAWFSGVKSSGAITAATNAASVVLTVANTAAVGDMAICHNVNGMAINGILGRVTAASASSVTLNINSTSLGTFTTSASSFVAFNDVYSSSDNLHPTTMGVRNLAQRYANGIRYGLRQLLPC